MRRQRDQRGQQIAELLGGLLVLVPIALFLLDMSVLVMSNQLADKYTKAAARAAANQGNADDATTAANSALNSFAKSGFITDLKVTNVNYVAIDPNNQTDPASGKVSVEVTMNVALPVPIPFLPAANSKPVFRTQAVEPVVSLPTNPPPPPGP